MDRFAFWVIVLIWLGGSLIAGGALGVAWFCVGAVYVGVTVWLDRRGDHHPTFGVAWSAAWHAFLGGTLIALGLRDLEWGSIVLFVPGTWFLVLAGGFTWLLLREHGLGDSDDEAPG